MSVIQNPSGPSAERLGAGIPYVGEAGKNPAVRDLAAFISFGGLENVTTSASYLVRRKRIESYYVLGREWPQNSKSLLTQCHGDWEAEGLKLWGKSVPGRQNSKCKGPAAGNSPP